MSRKLGNLVLVLGASIALLGASKVARVQEPKEYDRLDGHGPSGKKIDVIEWEGNLEIHSYPKGALRAIGMKIDRESKTTKNPVMVIEYAFNGVPYTMIRRAMLTIKLPDAFLAFRDASAEGYDKIIVSANRIADLPIYALAPPPTQLYPDHHEELEAPSSAPAAKPAVADEPAKTYERKAHPNGGETREPASPGIQLHRASEVQQDENGTVRRRKDVEEENEKRIQNFSF
jgi:hypothetical protein